MKITKMEMWHVEIPLPSAFYPAWIPGFPQEHNRFTLLKLITDEGVEGISAGVAFAREAAGLGSLGIFFLNVDPFDVSTMMTRLRAASFLGLRVWWMEAAMWDIMGKVTGVPAYKLMNGHNSRIMAYASTGEVRPKGKRIEDVLKLKEAGYKAVKLRAHSMDLNNDIDTVQAVRDAVGDDMKIMVDANQGWRVEILAPAPLWSVRDAMYFADAMEELDISWIEEPLDKDNYKGLAELRNSTTVPIAGGEFNAGIHEFEMLMEVGALDIYQPDATISGGLSTLKKVSDQCETRGLKFSPHTWTNGIGLLINMQAMAASNSCSFCEFPLEEPGWVPEARDAILTEPIMPDKDGYMNVPDKPGLGIELDSKKLEKYGEKFFSI